MTLRVVPEGLARASAAIEALPECLAAAHAGAVPPITAVVSSAAELVSPQTTTALSVRGREHAALATQGVEQLGRSPVAVGESATSDAAGDAASSSYLITGSSR